MQRRHLLAGAALAAALPARAAPAPWADDTWLDAARRRALPLRLRWPDGTAPCALVVHSHGLGGSRAGGEVWGRAWRDAGFAVLHVQHPGSDIDSLRGGWRNAVSAEQLLARAADMRFVLDEIARRAAQPGDAFARVRQEAIGASGHSFGAHTVQAVAGQRYGAGVRGLADARYAAFIALSPAPARRGTASLQAQFGAIERPFLAITGSLDGDPLTHSFDATVRASVYDGLPPGQRALLWLGGADHMSFGGGNGTTRGTGSRERAAIEGEARHHAAVIRISTLWWRAHLLRDAQAVAALREAGAGLGPADRWQFD